MIHNEEVVELAWIDTRNRTRNVDTETWGGFLLGGSRGHRSCREILPDWRLGNQKYGSSWEQKNAWRWEEEEGEVESLPLARWEA